MEQLRQRYQGYKIPAGIRCAGEEIANTICVKKCCQLQLAEGTWLCYFVVSPKFLPSVVTSDTLEMLGEIVRKIFMVKIIQGGDKNATDRNVFWKGCSYR